MTVNGLIAALIEQRDRFGRGSHPVRLYPAANKHCAAYDVGFIASVSGGQPVVGIWMRGRT